MFVRQNQSRPAARCLAEARPGQRAARLWRLLLFALVAMPAGVIALPQPALGVVAAPGATFTKLTLLNGWGTYPGSATPAVADISGIVYFKGAISTSSGNTNDVAFFLPPAFRPAKHVVVPVDMCDSTEGELYIAPTGETEVISNGASSNATCFTSLDGATFALSPTSFTSLTLKNGWVNAPSGTAKAAVRVISAVVRFRGAIRTNGTQAEPFILKKEFRPATDVYVPVDLCNGDTGRLFIQPDGIVEVEAETSFAQAQCLTSLDGAWFAR